MFQHPIKRVNAMCKDDISAVFKPPMPHLVFPKYCDVCIIGGGVIGSSIAYWLTLRTKGELRVVVLERDSSYHMASTAQSIGGMRMQFTLPENIQLAIFSAQFMRNVPRLLKIEDEPAPDVHFQPHGYLRCVSESEVDWLDKCYQYQIESGVRADLLSKERLAARFPWLSVDGIELACHGKENEGWFDPLALLYALRNKAMDQGAIYVQGEAAGFEHCQDKYQLRSALVRVSNNTTERITAASYIVAAGASSNQIGRLAGLGEGDGILSCPIPVVPRKRFVYHVHAPDGAPGLDCPMVVDPSGVYFRRQGLDGHLVCGRSPTGLPDDPEPEIDTLDVRLDYFETHVRPVLEARVPGLGRLEVKSAWAGFYDYNEHDQCPIVGNHPLYRNLVMACGFGDCGVQQSPGVGRAIAELILEARYRTIDLSRFTFERCLANRELKEHIAI